MSLYAVNDTLVGTCAPELLVTRALFLAGALFSSSESALPRLPPSAGIPAALPLPAAESYMEQ